MRFDCIHSLASWRCTEWSSPLVPPPRRDPQLPPARRWKERRYLWADWDHCQQSTHIRWAEAWAVGQDDRVFTGSAFQCNFRRSWCQWFFLTFHKIITFLPLHHCNSLIYNIRLYSRKNCDIFTTKDNEHAWNNLHCMLWVNVLIISAQPILQLCRQRYSTASCTICSLDSTEDYRSLCESHPNPGLI